MLRTADFGLANYYSSKNNHPLTSNVMKLWYRLLSYCWVLQPIELVLISGVPDASWQRCSWAGHSCLEKLRWSSYIGFSSCVAHHQKITGKSSSFLQHFNCHRHINLVSMKSPLISLNDLWVC